MNIKIKSISQKSSKKDYSFKKNEANTFRILCETLQKIRETRGTNSKISICADYFRRLENDTDLHLAARFIGEGAFESVSGKKASVGSRTSATAAADFCEIDYERVFKPSRTATGSSSETIEKLMENMDTARNKRDPENLTLSEIEQIFEKLEQTTGRIEKQKILIDAWKRMTPVEIKYFIRMHGQGSLRIGFETRSVIVAVAEAFHQNPEDVRYVHMITGSIGKTAVHASSNRLDEASFRLFHPLSFMLASPIDNRHIENFHNYMAEEKFDGMRCQVHTDGKKVKLFSRDLNDITRSFPDVVDFFVQRELPPTVLDGEICVYKDKVILPFQLLQKRMGLKKPSKKILAKYPVLFIAFDLLYSNGSREFDHTLFERRTALDELSAEYNLPVSIQKKINSIEDVEKYFNRALKHGNEGLMLKKIASVYEYGQRRKSWLKVKKPGNSLDTVIMYAHACSGRRGGTYSDFTLGISVKEDDRYQEDFIPIGKAYGGYTDNDLNKMNKKIKELTVERYGPTLGLLPELMVEIEFDDIRVNKRTKAGYTLRLPRFKRIRWDLSPDDADTLSDVEKIYRKKIERERLKQDQNPSFWFGG
jgi:DNA ligase 1